MPASDNNGGLYVFVRHLEQPRTVSIGMLGTYRLEPGAYLYVGSARRNLEQRVGRHLAGTGKPRWHVDTLSRLELRGRRFALLLRGTTLTECTLNRMVGRVPSVTAPIPGFGASDCRAGCAAHLWYRRAAVSPSMLVDVLDMGELEVLEAPRHSAVAGS